MLWGHRKTAQHMPCDHHVAILFLLVDYVECNFVLRNTFLFDLIDMKRHLWETGRLENIVLKTHTPY